MAKMLRYKGKLYKEVESRKVLVDSARARRFGRFARRRFVDAEDYNETKTINSLCSQLERDFTRKMQELIGASIDDNLSNYSEPIIVMAKNKKVDFVEDGAFALSATFDLNSFLKYDDEKMDAAIKLYMDDGNEILMDKVGEASLIARDGKIAKISHINIDKGTLRAYLENEVYLIYKNN